MSTEIQFDAGVQRTNAIPIAKKGKSVRIKKPKKTEEPSVEEMAKP